MRGWTLGFVGLGPLLVSGACGSPAADDANDDVVIDGARALDAAVLDGGVTPDGDPDGTWRSALYPADWTPAFTAPDGGFLHDFSYAGYHRSEVALPAAWPGDSFDVTTYGAVAAPADSTAAFVAAIAAAQAAGGGVVYVPDGEYRLFGNLVVTASNVVIAGQSRDGTKLTFTDSNLNGNANITFAGGTPGNAPAAPLTIDGVARSFTIAVADASGFAIGDDVVIDQVITQAFIDEHAMDGLWDTGGNSALGDRKIFYRRQIVGIANGVITLDVPLRYPLKLRDTPTVRLDLGLLRECGLEHLSLNNAVDLLDANAAPRAHAVRLAHVSDCVVRDVATYDSSYAPTTDHLQSGGIEIVASKRVTVADSRMTHAQNHGDGGAGYGYEVSTSSDVLFRDDYVEDVRHGFIQNWDFGTTGVVWLRCEAVDDTAVNSGFTVPGRSEFHHRLAIANLFDASRDTAGYASYNRGDDSSNAGHAGSENVFWNVAGDGDGTRMSIYQVGRGYVIGTRDVTAMVEPDILDQLQGYADGTGPVDWLEGDGQGATLWPPSLFEDQLAKRLGR